MPQLVDTLVVLSKEPGAFGEDAKETALEVAHSLALAVRSNEMRREILERTKALERQLSRVNLFNEITRAIAARRDLHSILGAVAQRLEEGFAESADVWLSRSASSAGEPPDGQAVPTSALPDPNALLTDLPGLVDVRPGGVVYLADLRARDVPSARALVRERGMRSVVVIPLIVDGDVLGGLACARSDPDAFSRAERDFLGGLGEHVAVAVHQAHLDKQLEQAYNDLRETQRSAMQQERLRALGEMASGIAHDISNAISPVALYAGLIETREALDEQSQAYLRTIRLAVRDVEETVGRMRQFYRTREDEDLQPVDVNLAIQQALELTRPRWRDVPQERGVTIDLITDLKPDLPVVGGNAGEIRQTLTNLILNAVDAMPEGGTLSLITRSGVGSGASVIVEVADTGIGMEEETQARAFEPFFSTKGARGSGLGLATVYGTMQRHGGDVQVESTWGQGTTMRLLFPCHALTDEPVREKPALRPALLRILCVDDEPLVRDALEIVLLQEGHTVEMAAGGEAALAAVEASAKRGDSFDVVLTDLGMPRVDGRAVARGVKQMTPMTRVILLTGWGQRMLAEHDLPDHVDLLLSKPPTIEALTQALAQVASLT